MGTCGDWVGCNTVQCTKCQSWDQCGCSDVPRQGSLLSRWDVRVLIAALCGKVGVAVKIEDMIIQSHLQWYGHVMDGDINSQICEEVEITGK